MPIDFEKADPLYLQIADDVRHKISNGDLKVGDQLGSHKELAKFYDVSLITIKKAISNLIDDGFLYSRIGIGTYVARKNSQLNLAKHKSIGIVIRDLNYPFFSLITQILEEHAYTLGYKILFSNTGGVVEKEENQIKHYREIGVHGLAIATADHAYEVSPTIKHLLQDSFPFVMISYVDDPEIPFVGTDNEAGAYMATEFLIHKGYKHVGYMNGEIGNLVGDIRLRGYLKAMNNHKRSVLPGDVVRLPLRGAWNDYQSGYQIGEQFAKRSDRPDALFCYNDLSAIGFMEAIMNHGVRVPEDVAIVGFDDVERASFAAVPLTTIHQPTAEIGRIAMETLMDKIDGKPTINRVILPPKLIIRSSS